MEQSSVIIHKGGREEKYRVYVEDYVLSFLKEETGTLELSELFFYGFKEKNGGKYTVYGAGRSGNLAVFDKYDRLEEISCRLTQAGPVFLVKEKNGAEYEIKGYDVFYQDNKEMQNYLIGLKKGAAQNTQSAWEGQNVQNAGTVRADRSAHRGRGLRWNKSEQAGRSVYAGRNAHADRNAQADRNVYAGRNARAGRNAYADRNAQTGRNVSADRSVHTDREGKIETAVQKTSHHGITLQLGAILVALVAIVINSTNSYDKMQELNQSAEEVFFAMENQEAAEVTAPGSEKSEIVVERDVMKEEDILMLATFENKEQAEERDDAAEGQSAGEDKENVEGQTMVDADGQSEEDKESMEGQDKEEAGEQPEEDKGGTKGKDQEGTDGQTGEKDQKDIDGQTQGDSKEGSENQEEQEEQVEALSRNVTRYYEVERGDTLYTISQKIYGDTAYVQKICELNQITNPDNIRYGQKIILP